MRLPPFALVAVLALPAALPAQADTAAMPSPARRRVLLATPTHAFWRAKAPDTVQLDVETSRGTFTVELLRAWAPFGVDRFYNLARAGYYDDTRFFRVVPWYIAQFGLGSTPAVTATWRTRKLPMDSVRGTNVRGTLSFAQYDPKDRTTNVFINLRDNPSLDSLGFAPIGRVVAGMEVVVDSLHGGYGEIPAMAAPLGNPRRLYAEGNKYLDTEFPKLDRIVAIRVRPR